MNKKPIINKKAIEFETLVKLILMLVVIMIVLTIYFNSVRSVNESKVKCEKCVSSSSKCSLIETPVEGYGGCSGETPFCCIDNSNFE